MAGRETEPAAITTRETRTCQEAVALPRAVNPTAKRIEQALLWWVGGWVGGWVLVEWDGGWVGGYVLNGFANAEEGKENAGEDGSEDEDEAEGGRGLADVPPEFVLGVIDEVQLCGWVGGWVSLCWSSCLAPYCVWVGGWVGVV